MAHGGNDMAMLQNNILTNKKKKKKQKLALRTTGTEQRAIMPV